VKKDQEKVVTKLNSFLAWMQAENELTSDRAMVQIETKWLCDLTVEVTTQRWQTSYVG